MKKFDAKKFMTLRGLVAAASIAALLMGTAGAASIGDIYKTYDPETGKFSATGSRLTLNLENVAEMARSYNPNIRATVVQADLVETMTAWGGMYADQVVKEANANYYAMQNAVGKMSRAMETMLYSYYGLENSLKTLSFDIAAMERNEKKMAKLLELGMISQSEYDQFGVSFKEAKASYEDLESKRDNLLAQIAAYVNRSSDQIEIDGFQLLSDNEVYSRLSKIRNAEYEDAAKISMDILAADAAYEAAPENDFDDMIASLKLLEAENTHQTSFESLRADALLLGEKVSVANTRYAEAEKTFAAAEKRWQLGELSKMDYDTAVEQLHKDYVTKLSAHIAFDGAWRKFMNLNEKGIFQQ